MLHSTPFPSWSLDGHDFIQALFSDQCLSTVHYFEYHFHIHFLTRSSHIFLQSIIHHLRPYFQYYLSSVHYCQERSHNLLTRSSHL